MQTGLGWSNDAVTFVSVNDPNYWVLARTCLPGPMQAIIFSADYQWHVFSIPTDLNHDGTVDWSAGENTLRLLTWSGYSPYPSVSAWDAMIVSLDYDGNGIPDYRDNKDGLKVDVYWGPEHARSLAYANTGTLISGDYDVNPVAGSPTSISGSGSITSTVSGEAAVAFNVTYSWTTKMWSGDGGGGRSGRG